MKSILILITWLLCCTQLIDSRLVRVIPDDEVFPYTIQKGIVSYKEYFSLEHTIFELVEDDVVNLGGYIEWIKSMDPKLPLQVEIRTRYLHQSSWVEGPLRLILPDACSECVKPTRVSYNVSKLWTSCPPQKGDKWFIEPQVCDAKFIVPPSAPLGKWQFHFLFSQGLFGESHKFGSMYQAELIDV